MMVPCGWEEFPASYVSLGTREVIKMKSPRRFQTPLFQILIFRLPFNFKKGFLILSSGGRGTPCMITNVFLR